jgi:probable phosphomutase (TIGR03848 family)
VTLVLLVRHGLTAGTGTVLTGRMPGIPLDDRGREQAAALAARLASVPLDAIVTSPLERCRQTADAIAAARNSHPVAVHEDEQLAEVRYGDWTGKPLKRLAKEPLWRVVQAHPSAARFPGDDGESMPDMQHRALGAIRGWNDRLGAKAVYLVCSHGDVIKSVIADCLGMHLDMCQRIQVDPCSLSVIRYTPLRPFLLRMNDTGGELSTLVRPGPGDGGRAAGTPESAPAGRGRPGDSDAAIGGGAGG